MRLRFVLNAVLLAASAPALAEENYRVDPLHTASTFAVSHLGLSMQRGSFGKTSTPVSSSPPVTGSSRITG